MFLALETTKISKPLFELASDFDLKKVSITKRNHKVLKKLIGQRLPCYNAMKRLQEFLRKSSYFILAIDYTFDDNGSSAKNDLLLFDESSFYVTVNEYDDDEDKADLIKLSIKLALRFKSWLQHVSNIDEKMKFFLQMPILPAIFEKSSNLEVLSDNVVPSQHFVQMHKYCQQINMFSRLSHILYDNEIINKSKSRHYNLQRQHQMNITRIKSLMHQNPRGQAEYNLLLEFVVQSPYILIAVEYVFDDGIRSVTGYGDALFMDLSTMSLLVTEVKLVNKHISQKQVRKYLVTSQAKKYAVRLGSWITHLGGTPYKIKAVILTDEKNELMEVPGVEPGSLTVLSK